MNRSCVYTEKFQKLYKSLYKHHDMRTKGISRGAIIAAIIVVVIVIVGAAIALTRTPSKT
ncbi:hypothetical protein B9Q13_06080 [Candidatus Marsarchaeota G2 archaeon ECH_B_SAG-G16]|uniref:Uncharacterized protein n=1 Tax=Candidatus Marsarchaeota G2 archaeon ECH_B_SAG-G16 TaxID=1978167 RepID=A0A2R6BZ56_9ARCH|nr:MAG: hypothetical protein B9Q13_06080 [Candidatus Marsarchaeota G2 archaeon ECH_B_SAG-G16]